ncbi:hypothetical protein HIM_02631 [Hirsutella minnesotensis 3608]|nr:hypothetical protein HIM_02631 [Hirsutella minnesotensis 3608]
MLFLEEDAPLLKAWIVKRIENTSDADSDVLAEYVIALLKHDGDEDAIRKLCEQEIPDFLTEEPKAFLDDVFQAIKNRSYIPGAVPRASVGDVGQFPSGTEMLAQSSANVKKRAYGDSADQADGDEHDPSYLEHRSYKQARRGARQGPGDSRGGRRGGSRPGGLPALPTGMPQFDPSNPMEAIMQMQAMGIPFPPMQGFPQLAGGGKQQRNHAKRKGRCRDFDTKGYCSRGSTCMYDHGNESIYVPPSGNGEEYDPNDAVMHMPSMAGHGYLPMFNPEPAHGRGGRKSRGANSRAGRKGGARAPFSADGPVNDRSKSTIVIENIPEEKFSEGQVRDFFSQFGNIVEVSMQPYKHLAVVKYDKWAAANEAYRSPKAIFDNRFVKVFWYKEVDSTPQSAFLNGGGAHAGDDASDEREPEPQVDMEEFQKKQQEAQRQHQERQSKREELERQRQELEKKHQDLLAKHQAETEQLRAKLTEKNGGDAGSGSSSTDLLKAQLAALEQEAKILGLDPNATEDGGMPPFRGGYRGRRGYRGRGVSFPPRGRGSFRGQGARHAAYAQYSLDNRPKKVAVRGVDFSASDKDEVLRHFLLNLGEFESVETTPSVTYVSFQDRKTAERFYFGLHGKELPGVEGRLDLSWESSSSGPAPTSRPGGADSTSAPSDDGAGGTGTGDDDGPGFSKDDLGSAAAQRPVDMDYAMGDDEGWD